ncbi:ArsR/SmtB family transcription factor [Natronobacterium texcoconense]|uniref:Helix-turn-helix domain-containing protein n=1 Tax=Natronobacterium texcoconense TaxID=1095778 RepID=A0A1H1IVY6_NATTX|nr:winged helix-turn-helix domain-containing protein [Natronobacterium texcoconense]SDR41854.1 Helix-turn-helix domain-containing protein [Natronobacterium texcoconense]
MTDRGISHDDRTKARERVESELLAGALDLDREANRLSVMGEPTRFTILYLLAEEGQIRSGELADLLDRRQNDLYHHLDELENAGLVGKFRDSGSRVYELSPLAEGFVPQIFDAVGSRDEAV